MKILTGILVVMLLLVGSQLSEAQTVLMRDKFRTAPGTDRVPGAPLDGVRAERGHQRWKAAGLVFTDAESVAATDHTRDSFAALRFTDANYLAYNSATISTDLNPGSAGWVAVGFAGADPAAPFQQSGQIWLKLSANGQVSVWAEGSRHLLYQGAHPHPAFRPGTNRVQLSYDWRQHTVYASLNGVAIELEIADLDDVQFSPSISYTAVQGRPGALGGDAVVIDSLRLEVGTRLLRDNFTINHDLGRDPGTRLNGLELEVGNEYWEASSVTYNPGLSVFNFATNLELPDTNYAFVDFHPEDHPYATSVVSASVTFCATNNPSHCNDPNSIREINWGAVGFLYNYSMGFNNSDPKIWMELSPNGHKLQVKAKPRSGSPLQVLYSYDQGTPHPSFQGVTEPNVLKLSYNRISKQVEAWLNGDVLPITEGLVAEPDEPLLTHVGFQVDQTTYSPTYLWEQQIAVDSFLVSLFDGLPLLHFSQEPSTEATTEGIRAPVSFACAAYGGVGTRTYSWEECPRNPDGSYGTCTAVVDGIDPDDGTETSSTQTSDPELATLTLRRVGTLHQQYPRGYRCCVDDDDPGVPSICTEPAFLEVREPILADYFNQHPPSPDTDRTLGAALGGLKAEKAYWHQPAVAWQVNGVANLGDEDHEHPETEDVLTNTSEIVGSVVGGLALSPAELDEWRKTAVEALVDPAKLVGTDESAWIGVGFTGQPTAVFWNQGQVWVALFSNGRLKVFANGTALTLYAGSIPDPAYRPGEENLIKVEYGLDDHVVRAWLNGTEITIASPGLDTWGFTPNLAYAGFHAFVAAPAVAPSYQLMIDDFAVTAYDAADPLTATVDPVSQDVDFGLNAVITCQGAGGVPPYTFRWQRQAGNLSWYDLPNDPPFSIENLTDGTSRLTIFEVDEVDEGMYRCVVRDSHTYPANGLSAASELVVNLPDLKFYTYDCDPYCFIEATEPGPGLNRISSLEVGVPFDLHVAVQNSGPEVPPIGEGIPVQVWARYRAPNGVETEAGPWELIGSTSITEAVPNEYGVVIHGAVIPASLLPPGENWALLDVGVTVDMLVEPGQYDDGVVTEECETNDETITAWIPVSVGPLGPAVAASYWEQDFINGSQDCPDAAHTPSLACTGSSEYRVGSVYYFETDPVQSRTIPYAAWAAGGGDDIIVGMMVRYRRDHVGGIPRTLYAGWSDGEPADNADYGASETSLDPGQFHTVLWQSSDGGGPFDGLEVPQLVNSTVEAGNTTYAVVGVEEPDCAFPPCDTPYTTLDFVTVWTERGSGCDDDAYLDSTSLYRYDEANGWQPLSSLVGVDSTWKLGVRVVAVGDISLPSAEGSPDDFTATVTNQGHEVTFDVENAIRGPESGNEVFYELRNTDRGWGWTPGLGDNDFAISFAVEGDDCDESNNAGTFTVTAVVGCYTPGLNFPGRTP